jgi:hypothetical protein
MSDDERWGRLFDDLELQAVAAERASRGTQAGELARAELAGTVLADRLRARIGAAVTLRVAGVGSLPGVLERVATDCLLLHSSTGQEWLVAVPALVSVAGLGRESLGPPASVIDARLGLAHLLRGLARDRAAVAIVLTDGGPALDGTIDRVGSDYLELARHPVGELRRRGQVADVQLIALSAISAIRRAGPTN